MLPHDPGGLTTATYGKYLGRVTHCLLSAGSGYAVQYVVIHSSTADKANVQTPLVRFVAKKPNKTS